jgi:hypothetical protein
VLDGLAVTLEPVEAERPDAGDQEYVVPPVAVIVVDEPLQIATPVPALMVGIAFTVAVTAVLVDVVQDPIVELT